MKNMVWIILEKENKKSIRNLEIIDFGRNNFQRNNIDYKLLFVRNYMFDIEISDIKESDWVFWNPVIAAKNLANVTMFPNSVVVLKHETHINESISDLNPINENLAINYNFYLMYLDEKTVVSKEWRLPIQKDLYLFNQSTIMNKIMSDKNNFKQVKEPRYDVFEDIIDFTKNQINI